MNVISILSFHENESWLFLEYSLFFWNTMNILAIGPTSSPWLKASSLYSAISDMTLTRSMIVPERAIILLVCFVDLFSYLSSPMVQ